MACAQRLGAVARPGRADRAVAAAVDRPVRHVGGEVVAPARRVDAPVRRDAAEVVDDDREFARARAGEERAEALAVRDRQLRARPAVQVHAVDDALVGQVVVRQQAEIARAARRREQDRRVHARAADRVHERALLGAPGRPRDAAVAVGRRAVAGRVEGGLQPDRAILVERRGEVARERERLLGGAAVDGEDDDEIGGAGRGDGVLDRGQALVGVGDGRDVEAHRVDAHRGEHVRVARDAGQRLGVDRALAGSSARSARSPRRAR